MNSIKQIKHHILEEAFEHALELAGPQAVFFAEYQAKIIAELLQKQGCKPSRILDYGCGDGTMAYLMHALLPNAHMQGVDSSKDLIEIAQGWYGAKDNKLSFSTEITRTYDLIYVANVLHHIQKQERKAVIQELTTHLAPRGILIILEFNPLNPMEVWRFYRNKEERGNHMILPGTLKKLLAGYGKLHAYYFRKIYVISLKKP